MAKRYYAELLRFLEAHGYRYLRTNSKGFDVYRNDQSTRHTLVAIQSSITDAQAGHLTENISKDLGIPVKQAARKRSGKNVKQQHAAQRERDAAEVQRNKDDLTERRERKEAELDELRAEREVLIEQARREKELRDRQLGGLAKYLTNREVADITERIRQRERELLAWQTEVVGDRLTTNAHRHQA